MGSERTQLVFDPSASSEGNAESTHEEQCMSKQLGWRIKYGQRGGRQMLSPNLFITGTDEREPPITA
jgi:hypothetical protein